MFPTMNKWLDMRRRVQHDLLVWWAPEAEIFSLSILALSLPVGLHIVTGRADLSACQSISW